jgi:hypothetical protein
LPEYRYRLRPRPAEARFKVRFNITQEPVWLEDEAAEVEEFRRDGRQVPLPAPEVEANQTAADVYAGLPDRLIARITSPVDDPNFFYYLFFVPTTISAAPEITPRRLRLQLLFEDANNLNPSSAPVAYKLDPETQAVKKITNLGTLKVDLGSALRAIWPAIPNIITAKAGGSLDLIRVDAKVQAEGRNSHRCGWRISDAVIAYDFNPSCIVQVPKGARLSISATLRVEVWKQVAVAFHKTYLVTAEPARYLIPLLAGPGREADPDHDIILERPQRKSLMYSAEGKAGQQVPAPARGIISCSLCGAQLTAADPLEAYIGTLRYCKNCLAMTLGRCSSCGTSISGLKLNQDRGVNIYKEDFTLPISCENCGEDFSWVTPQQRIYWLERFIDRAEIGGEARLLVAYNLMLLRNNDLDEVQRLVVWRRIKMLMPDLFDGSARRTIETLLTAEMKTTLGWNEDLRPAALPSPNLGCRLTLRSQNFLF